jgi:predicted small integral membrane protein
MATNHPSHYTRLNWFYKWLPSLLNERKHLKMNKRLIKIFLGVSIGLYMLLVCFNNIMDYGSNFQFVSKVSGMEDVFSNKKNGWRSINSKVLQHIFYLIIIAWEIVITLFVAVGVARMVRKLKSNAADFEYSKRFLTIGLFLGVILWFSIFVSIGGEWFLMWQSKIWNGQNNAFLLSISFMLFLIHHNLHDD